MASRYHAISTTKHNGNILLAFVLLANLLFVTVFSLSFSTICTLTAMRFNANTVFGTV